MSKFIELKDEVVRQQKDFKAGMAEFSVGLQLLDMAHGDENACEIILTDLKLPNMGLKAAAGKIKEYADRNHGKSNCFCVTPDTAEKILREFYGLPERETEIEVEETEKKTVTEEKPEGFIDLESFLVM